MDPFRYASTRVRHKKSASNFFILLTFCTTKSRPFLYEEYLDRILPGLTLHGIHAFTVVSRIGSLLSWYRHIWDDEGCLTTGVVS